MRRINIVIDPELDDRIEREAAARGTSKSAVVRECVEKGLAHGVEDNGLLALLELSKLSSPTSSLPTSTRSSTARSIRTRP